MSFIFCVVFKWSLIFEGGGLLKVKKNNDERNGSREQAHFKETLWLLQSMTAFVDWEEMENLDVCGVWRC